MPSPAVPDPEELGGEKDPPELGAEPGGVEASTRDALYWDEHSEDVNLVEWAHTMLVVKSLCHIVPNQKHVFLFACVCGAGFGILHFTYCKSWPLKSLLLLDLRNQLMGFVSADAHILSVSDGVVSTVSSRCTGSTRRRP